MGVPQEQYLNLCVGEKRIRLMKHFSSLIGRLRPAESFAEFSSFGGVKKLSTVCPRARKLD